MKYEETYQHNVKEGDIVQMPGGTLAIVKSWDIICAGHFKEVRVFPLTNWLHRLLLVLTDKVTFYDKDINRLTLVSPA